MEFKVLPRSPQQENGYRLASVEEVTENFPTIKDRQILDVWYIVRLLDGWVTGPGYRYELRVGYKPEMGGHMLVVKTGVSRETSEEGRKAALLLSLEDKSTEVLHWLLISTQNQNGSEAWKAILQYAIDSCNEKDALGFVEMLLEKKYELGKEFERTFYKIERRVLHLASLHGHAQLCYFLVKDCQLRVEDKGQNALHFAAKSNVQDGRVVKALLKGSSEQGNDDQILINSRDEKGNTPLHIAAETGNTIIVKELLSASQSPQEYVGQADSLGQTALLKAASRGHIPTMEQLLINGSQPPAERDGDGKTALHYAVQLDDSDNAIEEAKLLLRYCKSEEDKYLLLWSLAAGVGTAYESARSPRVERFLQQQMNTVLENIVRNTRDPSQNLLKSAATLGTKKMVWELFMEGANINAILSEQIEKIPRQGRDHPTLEDSLGRSVFAEGLAALFLNPHIQTPVTVGISGAWGMGKSSLMLQTEIILLKAAAQLAFPNLIQTKNFLGAQARRLSEEGRKKYQKIRNGVERLLASERFSGEHPLVHFLDEYRPQHCAVFKSLAVMDRSEMFVKLPEGQIQRVEAMQTPSVLTVHYNAWHYQNETEAWAGLAVEITRVMEETMTNAQKLSTRWRYAWGRENRSICIDLILPCLLATFVAGWVAWAAWMLLGKHKELSDLKYGSIPITIIGIVWVVVKSVMSVLKPISAQLMGYIISLPDHTTNLGYQQKVIDDINFLKEEISRYPSWFYKFLAGEWCWNWFGLCSNSIEGTSIPKSKPASKDNLRIITFVDDLDRCQDTVILQVLSAVHLVLSACEINVILGMDKKMIERAIGNKFKETNQVASQTMTNRMVEDLADKFMRKIIQLDLALPDPSANESKGFLARQLGGIVEWNDGFKDTQETQTQGGLTDQIPSDQDEPATLEETQNLLGETPSLSDNHVVQIDRNNGTITPSSSEPLRNFIRFLKACGDGISSWFCLTCNEEKPPTKFLEGTCLTRQMMLPAYSEVEQEVFSYMRQFATDNQKLPREWKRLLNYYRLAWNILSKNAQVTTLAGWQAQLVAWIFCCWQWKDQINIVIQNWHKLEVLKGDFRRAELERNEESGPSLKIIVDLYIDERWPQKPDGSAVLVQEKPNADNEIEPVQVESESSNITVQVESESSNIKIPRNPSKEEAAEEEKEQKEKQVWMKLKEALSKYDVSMTGIQCFQHFRLYCETGHLPWQR
eukprot:Gb_26217 [translate_table: standard]